MCFFSPLRALMPSCLFPPLCLDAFSKDTRTFAKPQVRLPGSIRVHLWLLLLAPPLMALGSSLILPRDHSSRLYTTCLRASPPQSVFIGVYLWFLPLLRAQTSGARHNGRKQAKLSLQLAPVSLGKPKLSGRKGLDRVARNDLCAPK